MPPPLSRSTSCSIILPPWKPRLREWWRRGARRPRQRHGLEQRAHLIRVREPPRAEHEAGLLARRCRRDELLQPRFKAECQQKLALRQWPPGHEPFRCAHARKLSEIHMRAEVGFAGRLQRIGIAMAA